MAPKKKQKKPKKMTKAARARIIARTILLKPYTASVTLPINSEEGSKRPALSNRFPFFASGLTPKSICGSDYVKPTCYGTWEGKKNSKLGPKRLKLVKPTDEETAAACKRVGGRLEPGYPKPIRSDKVDIAFLSPAQAKKLSKASPGPTSSPVVPGPNLRLCLRDDEKGYLVPVANPEQAQKLQREFKACTKGRKRNMPSCAFKVASSIVRNPPLGGFGLSRGFFR